MLRFISCNNCKTAFLIIISIHLMLRFINQATPTQLSSATFQYISCYGLSCNQVDSFIAEYHFNTSHVTVYLLTFCALFGRIPISIHLMLRFIRMYIMSWKRISKISIHLMLRFIPIFPLHRPYPYQISIHLMLRFIGWCSGRFSGWLYFNTSHVTVYLLTFCALFGRIPISIHLMLRFIVSEIK